MNTPAYVECLDINNTGKKSSTVAMFKPLEWKDCWLGVWELASELTESGKKECLYFMLVNDGQTCGVYMSDDVNQIMRPYHAKHLKRVTDGYNDDKKCEPRMTAIIASAFMEIVMKRWDVECQFMCPKLDFDFPLNAYFLVSKECEKITYKTFSKNKLKIDSANVYFNMKADGNSIFHDIYTTFFEQKIAA